MLGKILRESDCAGKELPKVGKAALSKKNTNILYLTTNSVIENYIYYKYFHHQIDIKNLLWYLTCI